MPVVGVTPWSLFAWNIVGLYCRAFGVSFGIYCIVTVVVFFFFGFARKSKLCKKYYAPKR